MDINIEQLGIYFITIIIPLTLFIIALVKFCHYYQDRKKKKDEELLNSNKKVWIAILQPNTRLKGGFTRNGFTYKIGKEVYITEKEKRSLEESYNKDIEQIKFKKLNN